MTRDHRLHQAKQVRDDDLAVARPEAAVVGDVFLDRLSGALEMAVDRAEELEYGLAVKSVIRIVLWMRGGNSPGSVPAADRLDEHVVRGSTYLFEKLFQVGRSCRGLAPRLRRVLSRRVQDRVRWMSQAACDRESLLTEVGVDGGA